MSANIRLQKEYIAIQKDPVPYAYAIPDPDDWLTWHFLIYGLSGAYTGGTYHGKIKFPANYPHSPPSMYFVTPNGRFHPNTNICTTMSNFHPEEWTPAWNVKTIITGLISFMFSNESSVGSFHTSDEQKKIFAKNTKDFNLKNPEFLNIFGDYIDKIYQDQEKVLKKNLGVRIANCLYNNAFGITVIGMFFAYYFFKNKSQ